MTNKKEIGNRIDVENRDKLCPEGIYRAVLKDVKVVGVAIHTARMTGVVQLEFQLNSNGEERIHYLINKKYIMTLVPGSCLHTDITCWLGRELTFKEGIQGIEFLKTLVGWSMDLEVIHVGQVPQRLAPYIRRIDQKGKLFEEYGSALSIPRMDKGSNTLADSSPCTTNMLNMMKSCVTTINNNLDQETTLPIVRQSVDMLETALAEDWIPKGQCETVILP